MSGSKRIVGVLAWAVLVPGLSESAAGAASAQEATSDRWQQVQSPKARAEVRNELAAAKTQGTLRHWSAGYIEPVGASALSRAQVREEARAALASGEIASVNAPVPPTAQHLPVRAQQQLAGR